MSSTDGTVATLARPPRVFDPPYPVPAWTARDLSVVLTTEYRGWLSVYRQAGVADLAMAAIAGHRAQPGTATPPPDVQAQMGDWAGLHLWQQGKKTYSVHPELSDSLADMKSRGQIPWTVLRRLPHPNPFVVFGHFPEYTYLDGTHARLIGALVLGVRAHEPGARAYMLTGTHDDEADGLSVQFFSEIIEGDQVVAWDRSRISLPLSGSSTLDQEVEAIIATYQFDHERVEPDRVRDQIGWAARMVLGHLLYLASDQPEIEPAPGGRSRKARKQKDQPAHVLNVGWRIGRALGARREQRPTTGQGTGRTVAPHIRGAHPHLYWTGTGRTIPRVKFLLPTKVGQGEIEIGTVTPVRDRRRASKKGDGE